MFVPFAEADWINLTGAETAPNIAEIYIVDDRVKVKLEVYVGDLSVFEDLVPDDWVNDLNVSRAPIEQRIKSFANNTFRIVTNSGNALPAKLELVEPRMRKDRNSPFAGMINPYTRQRVPEAPADKRVLYAEIVYPFDGKPPQLTFVPPLDDESRAKATIGFIAFHKAVPIIDFRYLGAPAKVNLNWLDPWYSKFENPNLKRHHKDALMSFLYVEPYEVRHEILTRVKDMAEWMDLGLRGDQYIEIDELEPLKQRIGEFLMSKNTVLIDGQQGKPILDRTNFVRVGVKGIRLMEKPQQLEISTAIVGVIITYLTAGMPTEVTVDWELFSERIQRVPATSIDPAGPLPTFVTPDDNVHKWTNFLKKYKLPSVDEVSIADTVNDLKLPVGSLLSLGLLLPIGWLTWARRKRGQSIRSHVVVAMFIIAGGVVLFPFLQVSMARPAITISQLSDDESKFILNTMLKNVYRAFDFRDESDVYDKLAISVQGDLLADVYLQSRQSMEIQQAGGAQAKVKEVEVLQARSQPLQGRDHGFSLKAKWTAMGTVGHWGHVHMRKNLYEAIVDIEAINGKWKITGLELLEEKRIDPATGGSNGAAQSNNTS